MEKIIGVGIDQIERSRIEQSCVKTTFVEKCFSSREQELIHKRSSRAATNFAGKEAVAKAMGTGFSGISLHEVEILREENGAPYVELTGKAREKMLELGIQKFHISLTDTRELAAAYVVAVGEE